MFRSLHARNATRKLIAPTVLTALALTGLAACSSPPSGSATASAPTGGATSSATPRTAMRETLEYLDTAATVRPGAKVAYLAECAAVNAYCQTRWKATRDAATKLGLKVTLLDANFDPKTQLQQVQDATQQGFDGYVFSPVADSAGCSMFSLLKATGKPVATINSPMCGHADYTAGTAGFVGMQTTSYFERVVGDAFASCTADCKVVTVGGYVGSDLYTRWENAIKTQKAKYPHVKVVSDQPGSFDPTAAYGVVQDALTKNPDISVVISSWDDMTRGVEKAVTAAGKKPGKDVRVYSVGGTKAGVANVVAGKWTSTAVLLPYEESYYGVVQLARALSTGKQTTGFTDLAQAPAIVDGPETPIITAANAAQFTPEY